MEARANILGLGRIGIGSWTYPWAVGTVRDCRPRQPMSPSGLVRQAAELGVKVVQIADNLPLDELTIAGFVLLGKPVGQGKLPLEQIFKRLAQFHHRPDVIVELWTPFTKTLEETLALERTWATESLHHLSTLATESLGPPS